MAKQAVAEVQIVDEHVLKTYEDMTTPTKELAVFCKKRLNSLRETDLMIRWEVGDRISQAAADTSRFGEAVIDQLSIYTSYQSDSLYKMQTMAETYSKDEMKEIADLRNASGDALTFNHIKALMLERNPEKRNKLLKEALANSYSYRDIERKLQHDKGGKKSSKGGRKAAPPKNPAIGMSQLQKMLEKLNRHYPLFQEHVFEKILEMSVGDYSPSLAEALATTVEALEDTQGAIEALLKEAQGCFSKVFQAVEEAKASAKSNGHTKTKGPKISKQETAENEPKKAAVLVKKKNKVPAKV